MISDELLQILVCPVCKGDLEHDRQGQRLICHACRLAYAIKDDIPIMLSEEAERLEGPRQPGAPA
jgi:hypothetical protein